MEKRPGGGQVVVGEGGGDFTGLHTNRLTLGKPSNFVSLSVCRDENDINDVSVGCTGS